ncbi:hypothetical protein LguiA_011133 [Lonicera macranthoides]
MTIEDIKSSLGVEIDNFPVGMRILAVDDDPTCLMLLDGLLRKCQYQVTTTSQAIRALKMLRENRNRFDLIISDVHMPDMDGFKLLEHVGLEMDLPVIMLSANSDPKLVMKGITHGACDYLLKPVRIEELRNIWQHVIRKKKIDPKAQNNSTTQDKDQGSEGGEGQTGNTDQSGKLNRKRKDEEEEGEENGYENDDPSAQKKQRVVWSIELHRKFVAAVNQLGIEKAVPKRILDLMNVEGITRENVASHLQKYRLYLKRISSVASQQANMVAALGGKDTSYLRMGSLDGLGDFRPLSSSGRLPNTALSSYSPSRILGRLNSPASLNVRSLTSSSLIQPNLAQSLSNSTNSLSKFQPVISSANVNAGLFQGISSSFELDHLQQSNSTTRIVDFNSVDDPRFFTAASAFTEPRVTIGSSSNSITNGPSNPLILPQGFTNQSLPLNADSFNTGTSGSCNENWPGGFQLSKFSSSPLPLSEPFSNGFLPPNSTRFSVSSSAPPIQGNPMNFSSCSTVSVSLEDSRGECHEGLFGGEIVQNMNQTLGQHKNDLAQNSGNAFSSFNSLAVNGRSNSSGSTIFQHGEVEKSTTEFKGRSNEDYLLGQTKLPGGFVPQSFDHSLDDLMTAVMKREQEGMPSMDGEFGFDTYTFGSCI